MNEIAPPAVARSGGATSPHGGMVPRPAASHPQPAGALRAGILVPPCKLAPARLVSRRGISWTREEVERLEALRAEGRTRDEAAAILGRSLYAVDSAIKKHRLDRVREPQWTAGEYRTLLRMKIARKTTAEIAAELGRTPRATAHKWQMMTDRLPPALVEEIYRDMIRMGGRPTKGGA